MLITSTLKVARLTWIPIHIHPGFEIQDQKCHISIYIIDVHVGIITVDASGWKIQAKINFIGFLFLIWLNFKLNVSHIFLVNRTSLKLVFCLLLFCDHPCLVSMANSLLVCSNLFFSIQLGGHLNLFHFPPWFVQYCSSRQVFLQGTAQVAWVCNC